MLAAGSLLARRTLLAVLARRALLTRRTLLAVLAPWTLVTGGPLLASRSRRATKASLTALALLTTGVRRPSRDDRVGGGLGALRRRPRPPTLGPGLVQINSAVA